MEEYSTRQIRVDYRFAGLLEQDFGISAYTIHKALIGSPQRAAIAICEWAAGTDDPAKALTNYARKNRTGSYRPEVQRRERYEVPEVDPAVDAWLAGAV